MRSTQSPPIKKVDVIALVADGCIFHPYFYTQREVRGKPVAANQHLIDKWVRDIKNTQPDLVIFTVLDRQSRNEDHSATLHKHQNTSIQSMSFYPVMYLLMEATKKALAHANIHAACTVDTSLLADLFKNQPLGTALKSALAADQVKTQHALAIIDQSHWLASYFQIHHIAAQHKNAQIRFTVHDHAEFKHLPSALIPKSVLFRVCKYNGSPHIVSGEMNGTGEIDFHVRATILETVRLAGIDVSAPAVYFAKHCINTAFTGIKNVDRLTQLKKFIADNNRYAHSAILRCFKPTKLTTIEECADEKEDECDFSLTHAS